MLEHFSSKQFKTHSNFEIMSNGIVVNFTSTEKNMCKTVFILNNDSSMMVLEKLLTCKGAAAATAGTA